MSNDNAIRGRVYVLGDNIDTRSDIAVITNLDVANFGLNRRLSVYDNAVTDCDAGVASTTCRGVRQKSLVRAAGSAPRSSSNRTSSRSGRAPTGDVATASCSGVQPR